MLIFVKERSAIASIEGCKGVVEGPDFWQPTLSDHKIRPDLKDSHKQTTRLHNVATV